MIQKLPIALPQAKGSNTSEIWLNEIREIICSLYRGKQITKKAYYKIRNSIKLYNRMNTRFLNLRFNLDYLTKSDLKNAADVAHRYLLKNDLANLKSEVDKLDIDKLSELDADK